MKRKGFTLVELLVTVVLLSVISGIIIFNMTSVSKNSKESNYEKYIATVTSAASTYASLSPEVFADLYVNKAFIYITVSDLVLNGDLDEDLVNPYTGEKIGLDELVKVQLDADGNLEFIYPFNKDDINDTYMVALADYVVWGEPYDCMTGVGTYQLVISDEDGNFILDKTPEETKKLYQTKYSLTCEMPASFSTKKVGSFEGKATEKAGSYDVVYNWVNEDGVRKSKKRILKVLPKASPEVRFKDNKGASWNELDSNGRTLNTYKPSYDGAWNYLMLYPYIDGVDKKTTSYSIIASVHHQGSDATSHTGEYVDGNLLFPTTAGYKEKWPGETYDINDTKNNVKTIAKESKNWDSVYEALDGSIDYSIQIQVQGHYVTDYKYYSQQTIAAEQDITIPKSFITIYGDPKLYTNERKLALKTPRTLVGVDHYEFYITNEATDKPNGETKGLLFSPVISLKEGNVVNGEKISCGSGKKVEYKYIYFRTINKNGYVASWSEINDNYITNNLSELVYTKCEYKNVSSFKSYMGSLSNLSCVNRTKNTQVTLIANDNSEHQYTALGVFNPNADKKKNVLLTADVFGAASLVQQRTGSGTVHHCDGSFTLSYVYSSATYGVIKSKLAEFYGLLPTLKDGSKSNGGYTVNHNWSGDFPYSSNYVYTGYAGIPTLNQYLYVFQSALNSSGPFWLATSSRQNSYVWGKDNTGHSGTVSFSTEYVSASNGSYSNYSWIGTGATKYIKPMFIGTEMIACDGDGSSSNPFKVTNVSKG